MEVLRKSASTGKPDLLYGLPPEPLGSWAITYNGSPGFNI